MNAVVQYSLMYHSVFFPLFNTAAYNNNNNNKSDKNKNRNTNEDQGTGQDWKVLMVGSFVDITDTW